MTIISLNKMLMDLEPILMATQKKLIDQGLWL